MNSLSDATAAFVQIYALLLSLPRHSRAGGNPDRTELRECATFDPTRILDSRLRGNDDICRARATSAVIMRRPIYALLAELWALRLDIGLQCLHLRRIQMQAELGAPPENILSSGHPFLLDQIIDFART